MAQERKDEILDKALASDPVAVPRYDIVAPDGTRTIQNAEIVLKNPILREGMPYSAQFANEVLAASGVASGEFNFSLAQTGFKLADGAVVLAKLLYPLASGQNYTLNVNGTGAKAIVTRNNKTSLGRQAANTWTYLIYSSSLDRYVLVCDPEYQSLVMLCYSKITITIPTGGWAYDSARDRYYIDVTCSTAYAMYEPQLIIDPSVAGPKVPVYGIASYNGYVRLYATDVPTIASTATLKMLGVVN